MAGQRLAARYLISRYGDPAFALFIGFSAALVRIRKEEYEKRSGFPSASIVISPAQRVRMDTEQEERRKRQSAHTPMYTLQDYGSSETYAEPWDRSKDRGPNGDADMGSQLNVGYGEIVRLGWERIKWRTDYWWHERSKKVDRTDGRLI